MTGGGWEIYRAEGERGKGNGWNERGEGMEDEVYGRENKGELEGGDGERERMEEWRG